MLESQKLQSNTKRWIISASITATIILIFSLIPIWTPTEKKSFVQEIQNTEITLINTTTKKTVEEQETAPKKIVVEKKIETKKKKNESVVKKQNQKSENVVEQIIAEPQLDSKTDLENESSDLENDNASEKNNVEQIPIDEEKQKLISDYKKYALSRIASKKTYPREARTQGLEGKVKIHAIINSEGMATLCEIFTPCDFDILNDAAESAVKKSEPFKKLPSGLDFIELKFTMDFSLVNP